MKTTNETSLAAAQALQERIKLEKSFDVLEIGCGTGLLSCHVAPHVNRVLGVDTSKGMINKFNSKKNKHPNIEGLVLLLEKEDQVKQHTNNRFDKFDLVTSHLVFHHIPEMLPTIQVGHDCLKPGGRIFITDFLETPESRAFHPESKMDGVERHGLSKEQMAALLKKAGFTDVQVEVPFSHNKEVENGGEQSFPFISCTGTRPLQ